MHFHCPIPDAEVEQTRSFAAVHSCGSEGCEGRWIDGFGARGSEVVIHSLRILMFGNSWIDGRATETYRNIQKHTETYRDSDIVMNLGWVNSNRWVSCLLKHLQPATDSFLFLWTSKDWPAAVLWLWEQDLTRTPGHTLAGVFQVSSDILPLVPPLVQICSEAAQTRIHSIFVQKFWPLLFSSGRYVCLDCFD